MLDTSIPYTSAKNSDRPQIASEVANLILYLYLKTNENAIKNISNVVQSRIHLCLTMYGFLV